MSGESATFFDEVAAAIMETPDFKESLVGGSHVVMAHERKVRAMLVAAARMGAEGAVTLMPEHVPTPAMWVCATCHLPVALVAKDDDTSEWVHA